MRFKQQQTICSASAAALASMAKAWASPLILIASASASASKVILFLSAAAIVSNLHEIRLQVCENGHKKSFKLTFIKYIDFFNYKTARL